MLVVSPGDRVIKLVCRECHGRFDYPETKSNNRPRYCTPCREFRTASNKRRFDDLRNEPHIPVDKKVFLANIPDFEMMPHKIVDAAIRECDTPHTKVFKK